MSNTTTTAKLQSVKHVLDVQEISEEQIRKDGREYNPSLWDETISRYAKYKNCKFYVAQPQRGCDYIRFYAVYEIPEGIILFGDVSYHSMISSNGFCRVVIGSDGLVTRHLLKDGNGNEGHCNNDKANRKILAINSQKHGAIFTNNF